MLEEIRVYTDGSYNRRIPDVCGYAAIIVLGETHDEYLCDIVFGAVVGNKKYSSSNNVGGEIAAAEYGLQYIVDNYVGARVSLFHDYIGIGNWPNGLWKCNKPLTKEYVEKIRSYRESINIRFTHVYGHKGNVLNEYADIYAKRGISQYQSCGDMHRVIKDIRISKYL